MIGGFDVVAVAQALARSASPDCLDLGALGVSDRNSYRAFVDAWKAARLERARRCREAKAEMRLKGRDPDLDERRSRAQFLRERLRCELRALHALRRAAKDAVRRRTAGRRG